MGTRIDHSYGGGGRRITGGREHDDDQSRDDDDSVCGNGGRDHSTIRPPVIIIDVRTTHDDLEIHTPHDGGMLWTSHPDHGVDHPGLVGWDGGDGGLLGTRPILEWRYRNVDEHV